MIKTLTLLLATLSFFSFQIHAQSTDASSDSKTKVYKYKLKLQPLAEKIDLEYCMQNLENESLFECTTGSYNFENGAYVEKIVALIKSMQSETNAIENFKKASLKSIGNDSAKIEVYQNNEYNYSYLLIGSDTLIGTKKIDEPSINYYFFSKKGNYHYTTEMGLLQQLHSSQNTFTIPELPIQILGHNTTISKIKFLNKMYSSTTLFTNEINETSNLIYDFQYPSNPNIFPLQFNLLKNGNKYVFELVSEKELPNSKAINKKMKTIQEKRLDKLPLNELFQMVGFEY
ncbi:MAG: hypothetical protein RIQ33_2572 [Bacteroidota bacterium]